MKAMEVMQWISMILLYMLLTISIYHIILKVTGHSPAQITVLGGILAALITLVLGGLNASHRLSGEMAEFKEHTVEGLREVKAELKEAKKEIKTEIKDIKLDIRKLEKSNIKTEMELATIKKAVEKISG